MTLKAEQTAGQAKSIEDAKHSRFYKRNFTYIAQKHIYFWLFVRIIWRGYKDVPIQWAFSHGSGQIFYTRLEISIIWHFNTLERDTEFSIRFLGIKIHTTSSRWDHKRCKLKIVWKVYLLRWQMAGFF